MEVYLPEPYRIRIEKILRRSYKMPELAEFRNYMGDHNYYDPRYHVGWLCSSSNINNVWAM